MQPEIPIQNLVPEQTPVQYEPKTETLSGPNSLKPEIEINAERHEQQAEAKAIISDIGLTTVLPTPVASTTSVADDTTITINPLIAKDDDLIEKEWVDKAKKIVDETRNDPHQRENEVSKLQIDYIKKRFGRELGVAE